MASNVTPRPLTFYSIREDVPGPAWLDLFAVTAPAYRSWFLRRGRRPLPPPAEAERQLRRHMPELVPTWEHLCQLIDGDPDMSQMLTLWNPPPFLPGCSQAVVVDHDGPLLVRNYDYDPALCERVVVGTRWNDRRVLGTSDCLWGLVDGMNDRGVAASLTYAGRSGVGEGFGIPLVLRYVLETCDTVAGARATLARLPVHMAYNVTVVDANADVATFFVAPGQSPEEFTTGIATNHRGRTPDDAVHARRFQSVERQNRLTQLVRDAIEPERLLQRFLEPPLYNTNWDNAFGTVYTAAYRPAGGTLDLVWPSTRWRRTFDSATDSHQVTLDREAALPVRPTGGGSTGLTRSPTPHQNVDMDEVAGPGPQVLGDTVRRAIAALAESDDPAAFNELLSLSGEVGTALGLSARNLANSQSWAGVGQYAGLSRQTAWARWGRAEDD